MQLPKQRYLAVLWFIVLAESFFAHTVFSAGPPRKITIWINAFIPREIEGLTKEVQKGQHKGSTVISGPTWVNDCFLTDQRTFSNDSKASSRLHSSCMIDVAKGFRLSQEHRCGESIEIDCEDGDVEGTATASTKGMSFEVVKSDANTMEIQVTGAANNPLFKGSFDIDYEGKFVVDKKTGAVTFAGKVDAFPAFEGYVMYDDGDAKKLFQIGIGKGKTPKNLAGKASEAVKGEVAP